MIAHEPPVLEPVLDPVALADHLGVPLATVYEWNKARSGPPRIRLGRHVRYRVTDVEKWLDSRVVTD